MIATLAAASAGVNVEGGGGWWRDEAKGSPPLIRTCEPLVLGRYVFGAPIAFGAFLAYHRAEVVSDQLLRERGEGDSALTNAHIKVPASCF